MTALITADLQWSPLPRDRYRLDFNKQLISLIKKHKVDDLYILGDLTEQKDEHPAELVNAVVDNITKISTECDVTFLEGNHDYAQKDHPFFKFIELFDCVQWISEPTVIKKRLFLPHTRNVKDYWRGNPEFEEFDGDVIFAHNIFSGARGANGASLSGVAQSVFPKGVKVISGDVHDPQEFGCITYVGAPYLCDFGDDYEPRVLLLDNNNKLTSIKVTGPQKRLVVLADPDDTMKGKANTDDIVKIQVHLEMVDVASWQKIKKAIEHDAADLGWQLYTIQPIVSYVADRGGAAIKHHVKSDVQYLESYVKRLGVDKDTASTGTTILEAL